MNEVSCYNLNDKCPTCSSKLIAIINPITSLWEVDCTSCAKNLDRDLQKDTLFLIYDVSLK